MQLTTKIFEYTSFDFDFVKKFKISYTKKKIQNYSVNDFVCTLRNLGDKWRDLHYCKDISIFVDLLFTRCAFFCCYGYNYKIHDLIRYRICVGESPDSFEKPVYTEEQRKKKPLHD